jgi:hypothetical protein
LIVLPAAVRQLTPNIKTPILTWKMFANLSRSSTIEILVPEIHLEIAEKGVLSIFPKFLFILSDFVVTRNSSILNVAVFKNLNMVQFL